MKAQHELDRIIHNDDDDEVVTLDINHIILYSAPMIDIFRPDATPHCDTPLQRETI